MGEVVEEEMGEDDGGMEITRGMVVAVKGRGKDNVRGLVVFGLVTAYEFGL